MKNVKFNIYLLFILLIFCVHKSYATIPKDTLIVAHKIYDLMTLDPAAMFELPALEYANNTYERLVRYKNKGIDNEFQGVIAKEWKISKDGKTYTFIIHDDLKFSSGDPITASDVVFSLQRAILLNKFPSFILEQFGFNKENVKDRIYTISSNTLQIQFQDIFAPKFNIKLFNFTRCIYCKSKRSISPPRK